MILTKSERIRRIDKTIRKITDFLTCVYIVAYLMLNV
jgi:hypothetical protein